MVSTKKQVNEKSVTARDRRQFRSHHQKNVEVSREQSRDQETVANNNNGFSNDWLRVPYPTSFDQDLKATNWNIQHRGLISWHRSSSLCFSSSHQWRTNARITFAHQSCYSPFRSQTQSGRRRRSHRSAHMSGSPPQSFRLSSLCKGDETKKLCDLRESKSPPLKMSARSPSDNDENASPQLRNKQHDTPKQQQQSPWKQVQSPALFQLELEKQSSAFQLNFAEDRQKQLKDQIISLEEVVKATERHNERIENELSSAKQEIVKLQYEKDNLANEVRKLSRTIPNGQEPSSGSSVWSQMTAASRELSRVEDELASTQRDLNEARKENEMLSRQSEKYAMKETAHNCTVQELLSEKKKNEELVEKITSLLNENSLLKKQNEIQQMSFVKEMEYKDAICESLRQEVSSREKDYQMLCTEKERLQGMLQHERDYSGRESDISSLTASSDENSSKRKRESEIESSEAMHLLEEYKSKLNVSEGKRRKLLNDLQELRGNVRVFVRCRPFLPTDFATSTEKEQPKKCINCNVEGTTVSVSDASLRGAGQLFQFDKVFDESAQQEEVFSEVSDLVQSALDGFRVCIFSYGQTGSGKTHTMTGSGSGDNRGLISRSVELMIDRINFMRGSGWDVKATYSMLEVYNESLIDLLDSSDKSNSSKLQISMQSDRVVVKNLTEVPMTASTLSAGLVQLEDILKQANRTRATASTAMNVQSSRSHALFMMNISATHRDGTSVQGGLRLVDLAGSERLDRTGTQSNSARLRETVNINKSLSCLGDVFLGLSKKSAHIPYRNSKLTMLLQDCLGGSGKALMFVNISPTVESGQETVCSLKFASQVNQVQLGAAKKNVAVIQQTQVSYQSTSMYSMQSSSSSFSEKCSPVKQARSQTAPSHAAAMHSPIKPRQQAVSNPQRHPAQQGTLHRTSSRRIVPQSSSGALAKVKPKRSTGLWR